MLINITVTVILERSSGGEFQGSKESKRHSLPLFIMLSDDEAVTEAYIEPSEHLWETLFDIT